MGSKPKKWSERVKALVEKLGSREAVAAKLGVSFFTVHRWSEGEQEPSPLAQTAIEGLETDNAKGGKR